MTEEHGTKYCLPNKEVSSQLQKLFILLHSNIFENQVCINYESLRGFIEENIMSLHQTCNAV